MKMSNTVVSFNWIYCMMIVILRCAWIFAGCDHCTIGATEGTAEDVTSFSCSGLAESKHVLMLNISFKLT